MPIKPEFRGPPMANGTHSVRWDLVDPLLRYRVRVTGDLQRISQETGVSGTTLRKRRKVLGLPIAPCGRPRVRGLTALQETTLKELETKTATDIAASRGVTREAVSQLKITATAKLKSLCPGCQGYGVVACDRDCHNGKPHNHVCLMCADGRPIK